MFCVKGSDREKAFKALARLEVKATCVLKMSIPQFLQKKETPEGTLRCGLEPTVRFPFLV